ncbi:nuclear transport factor 2 family protein [Andreprevotia chitinilytica]|uniref:nuclear transport factor 2 family protein n=1 Tax=Andreprevotia chitinilytica TaxID=396808 RepID=UPI0005507388|nr:nuclear transport factor 2 family protein [Andreprevotia chitinilytica]
MANMVEFAPPESVIQQQLDAYNAHDLEGWLATYAHDAKQFEYPAKLLADGIDAIRERSIPRFQEPNLYAALRQRTVIGSMVIDHEDVTRTFPEGTGKVELIAIYQVVDGKIATASFVFGEKRLDVET